MLTWTDFTKKLCQIWVLASKTACSLWWSMSFSEARFPDQDRFWLAWIQLASPVHRRRKVEQWDWSGTFVPQPREHLKKIPTWHKGQKVEALSCDLWYRRLWITDVKPLFALSWKDAIYVVDLWQSPMSCYEVIWLAWALKPCACAQSWFLHELSEWRAWCGGWWDLSKGCITARTFHAFQGEIHWHNLHLSVVNRISWQFRESVEFNSPSMGKKGFWLDASLGLWESRECDAVADWPGPSQTDVAQKSADYSGWSEDVWRFDTAECDLDQGQVQPQPSSR